MLSLYGNNFAEFSPFNFFVPMFSFRFNDILDRGDRFEALERLGMTSSHVFHGTQAEFAAPEMMLAWFGEGPHSKAFGIRIPLLDSIKKFILYSEKYRKDTPPTA